MNAKVKDVLVLGLTVIVATGAAIAQQKPGKNHDPERAAARQELRKELTAWAKSNVLPAALGWKSRLDGAMSPEDLRKLNDLRARAATLRSTTMESAKGMREAWRSENYDALKSSREKMKELKKERQAIFEELKPLALKYRSTLEAIGGDAKPQVERWKGEVKGIVERWIAAHKDQIGDGSGHLGRLGGKWLGKMDDGMRRKAMVARFMLWNGDDFTERANEMLDGDGGADGFDLR